MWTGYKASGAGGWDQEVGSETGGRLGIGCQQKTESETVSITLGFVLGGGGVIH